MIHKAECCRICGNQNLVTVLDLGEQALTGVFPTHRDEKVTSGPLRLVKCVGDTCCGLLQLSHSYDLGEMYGDNYGYRSGLNASMMRHLKSKVVLISKMISLKESDIILDIGSNDGTTLGFYPDIGLDLIGIDPTAAKFRQFYKSNIRVVPEFFSASLFRREFHNRRARVVTSFSMFYDLERPLEFMQEVNSILADDGIWVFEQSYMPMMLDRNSYDTVCHEHLEYYGLRQIKWMTDRCGFKIVDVTFNDVNGGSFSVTVTKKESEFPEAANLNEILTKESEIGLDGLGPYLEFAQRVADSRTELVKFVKDAVDAGLRVAALGASTKGNVLLQYCSFSENGIFAVGEVNPDKFSKLTPGTLIPIIAEKQLISLKPDFLIVLPWHFRETFLKLAGGHSKIVFPLPRLEVH